MNRKILGILVMTLLIGTAMTTIAVNENNYNFSESRSFKPVDVPDSWLEGADQYQTDDYAYGMVISPLFHVAQEFKPTKEDLTAVALYFFSYNATSNIDITVIIRESLDGVDLTTKTINADDKIKKKGGTWVMFDFDDITIIPEETYYIVCYASGGEPYKYYCWSFDVANEYDRGIAYQSDDSGETWDDLEDPPGWDPEFVELDLCFITYFQEPPKNKAINSPFLQFLENHPHLFPLLRQLLGLQ